MLMWLINKIKVYRYKKLELNDLIKKVEKVKNIVVIEPEDLGFKSQEDNGDSILVIAHEKVFETLDFKKTVYLMGQAQEYNKKEWTPLYGDSHIENSHIPHHYSIVYTDIFACSKQIVNITSAGQNKMKVQVINIIRNFGEESFKKYNKGASIPERFK